MPTPILVQQGAVAAINSGVGAPSLTGVTAGNTLIVCYQVNDAVSINAPTDSAGQTWTRLVNFNAVGQAICIAWLQNANAGTHNLTFTTLADANESNITEWSGITGLGNAAVTGSSATVSTITTGSYTPSQPNELIIAMFGEIGSSASDHVQCTTAAFQGIGTTTDFGGFSCIGVEQNGSTFGCFESNARIITASAAQSATWTWTPANNGVTAILGFTYNAGAGGSSSNIVLLGQVLT
jgi:hypothetical protein